MSGFFIEAKEKNAIAVLYLNGFLDAHTAQQFENHLEKVIKDKKYKIVINLEKLDYISSAGLGVFMGYIEDIREKSGDIKICNASDKVFKVFDLLGFPNIFDICASEKEAIEKFGD